MAMEDKHLNVSFLDTSVQKRHPARVNGNVFRLVSGVPLEFSQPAAAARLKCPRRCRRSERRPPHAGASQSSQTPEGEEEKMKKPLN